MFDSITGARNERNRDTEGHAGCVIAVAILHVLRMGRSIAHLTFHKPQAKRESMDGLSAAAATTSTVPPSTAGSSQVVFPSASSTTLASSERPGIAESAVTVGLYRKKDGTFDRGDKFADGLKGFGGGTVSLPPPFPSKLPLPTPTTQHRNHGAMNKDSAHQSSNGGSDRSTRPQPHAAASTAPAEGQRNDARWLDTLPGSAPIEQCEAMDAKRTNGGFPDGASSEPSSDADNALRLFSSKGPSSCSVASCGGQIQPGLQADPSSLRDSHETRVFGKIRSMPSEESPGPDARRLFFDHEDAARDSRQLV